MSPTPALAHVKPNYLVIAHPLYVSCRTRSAACRGCGVLTRDAPGMEPLCPHPGIALTPTVSIGYFAIEPLHVVDIPWVV